MDIRNVRWPNVGPPFYALRGVSGSCCSRRLWIACRTLNRFWIACHPNFSSRPCCCLIYCLDYLARVSSNVSLNEYPAHTQHREKRSVPHNRGLVRYRTHLAGIGEYTCRPGDFLGVDRRSKKRMKVYSTAALQPAGSAFKRSANNIVPTNSPG